jgi:hypothetical protein
MPGHGEKQERLQELAISALLTEPTVEAAAAKVGVSYATLKGWLKDRAFREVYAATRREILEQTVARLLTLTEQACEALRRNLTAERPADQLKATALILEHAARGVEVLDLARQIAELRADVEAIKHGRGDDGPAAGEAPRGADPTGGGPAGPPGAVDPAPRPPDVGVSQPG